MPIIFTVFRSPQIFQPILKKDLGTFTEKLGQLRYPPYKEKTTNLLRLLFINRCLILSSFTVIVNESIPDPSLTSAG